jgi:hypothetical protein
MVEDNRTRDEEMNMSSLVPHRPPCARRGASRKLWLVVALLIVPGGVVVLGIGAMAQLIRRRTS